MNAVFNLATLSTVLNSAAFLLMFNHKHTSSRWTFGTYFTLTSLHMFFSGALYLDYFRFEGPDSELIKSWNKLAIAWIVFMFVFNLLPSFFVTSALMKFGQQKHDWMARFLELHRINGKFTYLAVAQIFCIIGYALCAGIKTTWVLGNDRSWLAMDGVLAFFLVLHSILNCLFIENVNFIAQLRSRVGTGGSSGAALLSHGNSSNTIFSSSPHRAKQIV